MVEKWGVPTTLHIYQLLTILDYLTWYQNKLKHATEPQQSDI